MRQIRHVAGDLRVVHHGQSQAVPSLAQQGRAYRVHRAAGATAIVDQQDATAAGRRADPLGAAAGALEADHPQRQCQDAGGHRGRYQSAPRDTDHGVGLPSRSTVQQSGDHPLGLVVAQEYRHAAGIQSLPFAHHGFLRLVNFA